MSHLMQYTGYIDGPKGPFVLARGGFKKDVQDKLEAFEAATNYEVETEIEEELLRVDVKQLVINLMGSSMGDLELVDVRGVASDLGDGIFRHHVLRRKGFDLHRPDRAVPPGPALAVLRHKGFGDYEWVFTQDGFEYLLENSLIGQDALVEWVRKVMASAPVIKEDPIR